MSSPSFLLIVPGFGIFPSKEKTLFLSEKYESDGPGRLSLFGMPGGREFPAYSELLEPLLTKGAPHRVKTQHRLDYKDQTHQHPKQVTQVEHFL